MVPDNDTAGCGLNVTPNLVLSLPDSATFQNITEESRSLSTPVECTCAIKRLRLLNSITY